VYVIHGIVIDRERSRGTAEISVENNRNPIKKGRNGPKYVLKPAQPPAPARALISIWILQHALDIIGTTNEWNKFDMKPVFLPVEHLNR